MKMERPFKFWLKYNMPGIYNMRQKIYCSPRIMNIDHIDISFTFNKNMYALSACSIKMKGYTKIKKNECNVTLNTFKLSVKATRRFFFYLLSFFALAVVVLRPR